jgi:hypothetical protein
MLKVPLHFQGFTTQNEKFMKNLHPIYWMIFLGILILQLGSCQQDQVHESLLTTSSRWRATFYMGDHTPQFQFDLSGERVKNLQAAFSSDNLTKLEHPAGEVLSGLYVRLEACDGVPIAPRIVKWDGSAGSDVIHVTHPNLVRFRGSSYFANEHLFLILASDRSTVEAARSLGIEVTWPLRSASSE